VQRYFVKIAVGARESSPLNNTKIFDSAVNNAIKNTSSTLITNNFTKRKEFIWPLLTNWVRNTKRLKLNAKKKKQTLISTKNKREQPK